MFYFYIYCVCPGTEIIEIVWFTITSPFGAWAALAGAVHFLPTTITKASTLMQIDNVLA